MEQFEALGLSVELLKALEKKGFTAPTPIQQKTIPALLQGEKNMIAQAQTGTGKTAAFGLPLLDLIDESSRKTQALVLCPTRELAVQVADEIHSLKGDKKIQVLPVYGGTPIHRQTRELKKGIQLLIGTPGRVIDHLRNGNIKLNNLKYLVLDEADEMLNMGFVEDVETVLEYSPEDRQMLLFSATMPQKISDLAHKYMPNYKMIKVKKKTLTTALVQQTYYEVRDRNRLDLLCRLIDLEKEFYAVIFCKTKRDTDELSRQLDSRGFRAEALHGDINQFQREKTLARFREKKISILVATDVAARGIDVDNVTHVINYSLPQDPESYVHRIGRTGRAGREGKAISFISKRDFRKLRFIERIAKTRMIKGRIPSVAVVQKARKQRLIDQIDESITLDHNMDVIKLSEALLEKHSPSDLVNALVGKLFEQQLQNKHDKKFID